MLRPSKTGQSTCIAAIMTWKSPFARTRAQEINWQYHTIPIPKPCIASNILRQQLDWDFSAILCDNWNFAVQSFLANVSNCFKLVHVNPSVQSPCDAVGTAWAQPHLLLKRLKILLLDILRWGQRMTEWQGISLEKKSDVSECSEKKTKQLQHVATCCNYVFKDRL